LDRLRAFSFHEIGLTGTELEEEMDVALSAVEAQWVRRYGERAKSEIEQLEQKERIVFYFDNIDELLARLPSDATAKLRRIDLLTVIELLQLYCDEPGFPSALEETAAMLLDVFI
jgi:hypothetical protein